jgi:hypothetical protein
MQQILANLGDLPMQGAPDLMCGEKQRNGENRNFKSAASAAVILAQIPAQFAVLMSCCLRKLPQTRQTYTWAIQDVELRPQPWDTSAVRLLSNGSRTIVSFHRANAIDRSVPATFRNSLSATCAEPSVFSASCEALSFLPFHAN